MSVAYRGTERAERIVIAERGRARASLLVLAALAIALGATFATTARLTVSCTRSNADESKTTNCYVEEAGPWSRVMHTSVFRDPKDVQVDAKGHVTVGGVPLLASDLDPRVLRALANQTVLTDDHALGHAGGWLLDLRVLLASLLSALILFALALRGHRVIFDRDAERISATRTIAFIPWSSHSTSIRAGDRASARIEEGRAQLLLVGSREPIVLLEDDERGGGIERLALRLDRALPQNES